MKFRLQLKIGIQLEIGIRLKFSIQLKIRIQLNIRLQTNRGDGLRGTGGGRGNISKIENMGDYYILYLWWQPTKKSKRVQ